MGPAWSYGGIEMFTTHEEERLHVAKWFLFLLALVAAPLMASAVALIRFWPWSGVVWILAGAAFWVFVFATAAEEPEHSNS